MLKIYAGIVTYNPDVVLLENNIRDILKQVDCVVIVDNASENVNIWKKFVRENNIVLIENKENYGIATALNQLCKFGIENGYDWILTLDQDSKIPDNLVEKLQRNIINDTAIVAPNIIYKNNEDYFDVNKRGCESVEWVITSASLTSLKVWKKISGFDEKLFIDGVDRDFCIRATRQGFKILKDYDICMLHELGNLKCRKWFGKVIYVTNHSAVRKYYMVRNAIYLDKKLDTHISVKYICKLLMKTLVYENKRNEKLRAIMRGIYDGKRMEK